MKRYAPFLYSLGTNALSFLISALTTFVVPKLLGATNPMDTGNFICFMYLI